MVSARAVSAEPAAGPTNPPPWMSVLPVIVTVVAAVTTSDAAPFMVSGLWL